MTLNLTGKIISTLLHLELETALLLLIVLCFYFLLSPVCHALAPIAVWYDASGNKPSIYVRLSSPDAACQQINADTASYNGGIAAQMIDSTNYQCIGTRIYPWATITHNLAVVSLGYLCPPGTVQSGNICAYTGANPDTNKGKPDCCEGNPINPTVGNKLQTEFDYVGAGAFPLIFARSYNSFGSAPGNLMLSASGSTAWSIFLRRDNSLPAFSFAATSVGSVTNSPIDKGWRHNYDRSISINSSSYEVLANVIRSDSRTYSFTSKNGAWTPTTGAEVGTRLVDVTDDQGNLIGRKFFNPADEIESYDTNGRLLSIQNRSGLEQTLHYDAQGRLDSVTDSAGRKITLAYDINGRLSGMMDPINGSYMYEYSVTGNLARVHYPNGNVRQYQYTDNRYPNALTGIVDENGILFATWQYDSQGRATFSAHANGVDQVTLSYGVNSTTASDAIGATRVYTTKVFAGRAKATQISESCTTGCSRSRSFSYDVNGNIASRTDFNGNQTIYAYDLTRNLETSRVEAAGTAQARTISTQWHSSYRLPIAIAEPKKLTTYTYDAKGNLLSKTEQATTDTSGTQAFTATLAGSARTWSYTYNNVGLVLSATDPLGNTTSYSYDSQGNLTVITNAAGQVTSLSNYDANGHVGRITDASGVNTDLTYSPRGWLTSKTTGGETTSYAYDGAGQLTQVTLPDGSTINYTYDNAHRLTDVVDSVGNSIHYTLDAVGNRITEQVKDTSGTLARQTTRVYDALNRLQQITGGVQ